MIWRKGVARSIEAHWEKVALLLLPFILATINSCWLINKNDIDVWFYYGYFHHFLDYWNTFSPSEGQTYYGTRIPYTALGHLVYSLFDAQAARYVLNLFVFYPIAVFSLFYVVRVHTSRGVAFVISAMLATDLFFIRTVGSDYVDNGVLIYQFITFVLLTKAIFSENPNIFIMISGFFATCMVFVHLLSVVFLPVFFAYYLFFSIERKKNRNLFTCLYILIYGLLGAAVCLVAWGLLFVYESGGSFLFFLPQIKIFFSERTSSYVLPVGKLFHQGYWLVIHMATLIAAVLSFVWLCIKKPSLDRYTLFWICTYPAFYALLATIKLEGLWFLASRDGLYATFFFPVTYMTLGVLIFRNGHLGMRVATILVVLFLCSVAIRLHMDNGAGIQTWISIPMVVLAAFVGLIGFSSFMLSAKRQRTSAIAACLVGFTTVAIPWKFDGNSSVFAAHDIIEHKAQGRLPKFFWPVQAADAPIDVDFASIVASFTERTWWQVGWSFPDCVQMYGRSVQPGDLIVILSRTRLGSKDLDQFEECIGEIEKTGEAVFKDRQGEYYVQFADVPKDAKINVFYRNGDKLPSQVGIVKDGYRFARDGEANEGFLTFGPYVEVSPGRYTINLSYSTNAELNWWDIVSKKNETITTVMRGNLHNTNGRITEIGIKVDLSEKMNDLEFRTYFSGKGDLSVHKLSMVRSESK